MRNRGTLALAQIEEKQYYKELILEAIMQFLTSIVISIYVSAISLWNLITPFLSLDEQVLSIGQNVIGWSALVVFLIMLVWPRVYRQDIVIGLLYANIIYSGGWMMFLLALEVWLIAFSLGKTRWEEKRMPLRIILTAVIAMEAASIVLLMTQSQYVVKGQTFLTSFWLDVCFVVGVCLYFEAEKITKLIEKIKEKFGTRGRAERGLPVRCAAVIVCGVLGALLLYGGYKVYAAQNLFVRGAVELPPDEETETTDGYVLALRSPNVQLAAGISTWTVSYYAEEAQQYALLLIDGTDYAPTVLSGTLPAGSNSITIEYEVTRKQKDANFCLYLMYNGKGVLQAGDTDVSQDGEILLSCIGEDYIVPFLTGGKNGYVDGFYSLCATYDMANLPEKESVRITSSAFDPTNYVYKISSMNSDGATYLLYDSSKAESESTEVEADVINYEVTASHVVVDLYRKLDDGNDISMEVSNKGNIDRIKWYVTVEIGIWVLAALAHLGKILIKERKDGKSLER
jgi:hypothetical protein